MLRQRFFRCRILARVIVLAGDKREYIKQRQTEGIAAAKEKGIRFGRRPMKKPDEFESLARKWKEGGISANRAAKLLGVSNHTFTRWVNEKNW